MPTLVGFGTFAALAEEKISEKVSRRILSGDHDVPVAAMWKARAHLDIAGLRNDRLVEHRGRCPCRAAQSHE